MGAVGVLDGSSCMGWEGGGGMIGAAGSSDGGGG